METIITINYQVIDCLDQISKLNEIINRHLTDPHTSGLATQYEYLREQFYQKLKTALAEDFCIEAELHFKTTNSVAA